MQIDSLELKRKNSVFLYRQVYNNKKITKQCSSDKLHAFAYCLLSVSLSELLHFLKVKRDISISDLYTRVANITQI